MGKKVRKYAAAQDFTKRKREKEAEKESPFSSIVLKEKKEAEKKTKAARVEKKRAGEVIQGYDPNASFADILANYERTGNPYAMPKKKNVQSESLSFGDILDKWEGKDKKKRPQNEVKKSTYKATKSFAEILSQYEGNPVREDKAFIIDEDVEVSVVEKEEKGEESPLFKKESECETRSPDASWSIYGNNESFERKVEAPSFITEEVGAKEKKPEKEQKKSTYKATKDFGEILKGFYSGQAEMEGEQKTEPDSVDEQKDSSESPLFKRVQGDETRSAEASWSVYGNNDSFIRKQEDKHLSSAPNEERVKTTDRKSEYKGKKEFSKLLDSYDTKKKERGEVKTFDEIIKEKGDVPEKREYTVSQLRTMMPQATLDLHGKTQQEAEDDVKRFLSECRAHKIRKISIITGKGLHSEGGVSILRDAIADLLDKDGGISERGNAPVQYGGSGAFWVILKK